MKKVLLLISVLSLVTGIIAKPEKGGKKPGSGEGRPSREEVMKKFDKDGDGKLNEDERAEARKAMEARRAEMIEKFDKDGDGKLNEEERKAAMASRTKPGGEGKPEGKGKKGEKGEKKKGKKEKK